MGLLLVGHESLLSKKYLNLPQTKAFSAYLLKPLTQSKKDASRDKATEGARVLSGVLSSPVLCGSCYWGTTGGGKLGST